MINNTISNRELDLQKKNDFLRRRIEELENKIDPVEMSTESASLKSS